MTEHAPDRIWSGIDIPKTIAGALAAVCAAVIGSFLGVAGTLVGAAVASIVGSVGTEVYARSLKKGTKKLEVLAPTFIRAPAAVGTPEVAAATEDDSPSRTVPESRRGTIRWGRVAAIAGTLFVLAIGSLTVAEMITGKPAASSLGNDSTAGRTTLTSVFGDERDRPASTPSEAPSEQPAPAQSPTSEPDATPSARPTASPTATGPTAEPTGTVPTEEPEQPEPTRATEPADPAPVEPADPDQPEQEAGE